MPFLPPNQQRQSTDVSDISTDEIIDTFAQSMSWLCDDVNTYYDMYYFLKVEFASWYYV